MHYITDQQLRIQYHRPHNHIHCPQWYRHSGGWCEEAFFRPINVSAPYTPHIVLHCCLRDKARSKGVFTWRALCNSHYWVVVNNMNFIAFAIRWNTAWFNTQSSFTLGTRMRSSRMRTVRCSGWLGGVCPPPPTEFLTHACGNITFSRLQLRTVKKRTRKYRC